MGLASILLWSTTIAVSRQVVEPLGPLTAGAAIYLLAGAVGVSVTIVRVGWKGLVASFNRRYWLVGGGLVVGYLVALYLALGWAETREQVIGVGLVNYLWPALTQVFSIPLLGKRARWSLPLGITLALAGAWLAATGGSLTIKAAGSLGPYVVMLPGAVAWALFSIISNKWGNTKGGTAMPFFLLAGGIALGLLRGIVHEPSAWTLPVGLTVAYISLFPGLLAYSLWELAVRRGNLVMISSLSYLTPVLSTLASVLLLQVALTWKFGLAALLVVAGALVCQASLLNQPQR
jgi:drug/metabolite transporter (DMT)-like permease